MKKHSLKERISYWFDNKMSRGTIVLIRYLAMVTLIVIVLITAILFIATAAEERDFGASFWDSMATVINAWMPSYEDGGPAYLILMSVAALVGLFITSVLIGIISGAFEEKITNLRRGNSVVLEENHVVVLGFTPGEYTLISQLVMAAGSRRECIVVAADMERDEMEDSIHANVDAPKNVRIICRTADISDPTDLERLAVSDARSIIVAPGDDNRTMKALLALSQIVDETESGARISAVTSNRLYTLPESMAEKHHIRELHTFNTIAKMIAHSCTQPGLSETFREVFNFDGSEFFLVRLPEAEGRTFGELSVSVDNAAPIGVEADGKLLLAPEADYRIQENSRILVFSEEWDSAVMREPASGLPPQEAVSLREKDDPAGRIVMIGCNETIGTLLRELPYNTSEILLAGDEEPFREIIDEALSDRPDLKLSYDHSDILKEDNLLHIAEKADHIVLLSDHGTDREEEADTRSILLLLHLRDFRERFRLQYNITAEMRRENNQTLIENDDLTDFVVASNMSSMFLAQLSENPELVGVFRELLSNEGSELYLKKASSFGLTGELSTAALRQSCLKLGYVFLGLLPNGAGASIFNPPLEARFTLSPDDQLIVIGEE